MASSCSITECEVDAFCRGWCRKHYARWWRNGHLDILDSWTRPSAPEGLRYCANCRRNLDLSAFSAQKRMRDGLDSWCLECARHRAREYRRTKGIEKAYGVTATQYEAMLLEQCGRCQVCGTDNPGMRCERFSIDHCHDTGKVRGLLCNRCNRAIGMFQDDPKLLQAAYDYLSRDTMGAE